MVIARNILAGFIMLWLVCCLAMGALGMVWTEATLVRLNMPRVSGLGEYADSVSLEISAADGSTMYLHNYRYGGRMPVSYDPADIAFLMERMREAHPSDTTKHWWGRLFLRLENIDAGTLEGYVADYYARSLLKMSRLKGVKLEILHAYTMERLKGEYKNGELYRVFFDSVHYAQNIYGISGAARAYFNKNVEELTLLETAYLVARVTDPSDVPDDKKVTYYDRVARQLVFEMFNEGRISLNEYRGQMESKIDFVSAEIPAVDNAVVSYIITGLMKTPGVGVGERSLKISTSYNKNAVDAAKKVLAEACAHDKGLQAALVMVNAQTGEIEAAVGSRADGSYRNRALSSRRQMGSTFKTVVYAAAFNSLRQPSDQILDQPHTFLNGASLYRPSNYAGVFKGLIPLRYGLVYSLNNATVLLAEQVGLERVKQTAQDMGFQGNIQPFYSMALGAFPTTPLNVAQIYATLANYGKYREVSFITGVKDSAGADVWQPDNKGVRAFDAVAAYQTMYIMQDVGVRGTAASAGLLPGTAAKTGTSDGNKDVWTAAICGPYVIVVWMGYDDFIPLSDDSTGGNMAAPVLAAFQNEYFGTDAVFTLKVPRNVVFAPVNASGVRVSKDGKGTYIEAFRKGYLPPKEKRSKKGGK